MREKPGISEDLLRACLQNLYDPIPVTLEFLPLGHDYNAGVYRVVSEQGTVYLLKAKLGTVYEPSCLVPRYLNDQGIESVVAPIRTKNNTLWTQLGAWTVIVYPFLEGDSSLTGMTNEQWKELGNIFHSIHQIVLPPEGFEFLRKETFDPTNYAHWIHTFETQHVHTEGGSPSERALHASWLAHQSIIHMMLTSMEKLAGVLQRRSGPYVICHADLHARNLIRDRAGHVFVVDWDDVMLAPKERDFIFIREPQADSFWEGYGQTEIDWIVLTYYRWERVVQDLIECSRDVCFRDDLGEASKADLLQSFDKSFAKEQSNLAAAYAAAAHLPSDLLS
jgi:spectinomycin phosphotransferase